MAMRCGLYAAAMGWGVLTVILAGVAAGSEASTAPATTQATTAQAATAPTSRPVFYGDWSSPRAAFLTFYRAMATRDAEGMRKSVAWEKPADGELAAQSMDAQSRQKAAAALDFCDLLLEKYPDEKKVQDYAKYAHMAIDAMEKGYADILRQVEELAAKLEEKIDGDTATLTFKVNETSSKVWKLRKAEIGWQMLPESVGAPFAPQNEEMRQKMAAAAAAQKRLGDILKEELAAYIKDVKADKYATGKDAMDALQHVQQEAAAKAKQDDGAGK